MFAALGLGALGTLGTLLSGCGPHDCTAVSWYEGLTVDLLSPGPVADGTYKLAIEADGVEVDLAVEYVDAFPAACYPDRQERSCSDVVELTIDRHLNAVIEASQSGISVNLFYQDRGSLAGGPDVASIQVRRDNETVVEGTFRPSYVRDEPNGDGCGVATRARYELALPPAQSALAAPD
jgi:hypothetical protein